MRVLPYLCLAIACVAANCGNAQSATEPVPAASPSDQPAPPSVELKPVQALGVEIGAPSGKLPPNYGAERLASAGVPAGVVLQRTWPVMTYHWTASASRHNPLYFEEVNAERYGYTHGRCLQPVVSAAHFFGTIPALPYLMAADCPRECVYTLGHYRPGNCNPYRKHWWPCQLDAATVEAGAAIGIIAILP